ncbi:MAG: T9SS type A sorting domain-containing protein, partial [Bacteroidetes bacterium]|nr:T9SS type A sorting domain-containing protein [Bacteroidota bacterium]
PNPASDFINIDIKNINSTKLIIDIFDIVGQKINSFIIPDNKSSLIHKTIPTKEFANSSGCYFVKISGKDFFSVKKVVIK